VRHNVANLSEGCDISGPLCDIISQCDAYILPWNLLVTFDDVLQSFLEPGLTRLVTVTQLQVCHPGARMNLFVDGDESHTHSSL
jgi:hypothetical protein